MPQTIIGEIFWGVGIGIVILAIMFAPQLIWPPGGPPGGEW
jgi:hypothetical protein